MALNKRGHEVPDPTPVEIASTLRQPESMEDMIRRFVRVEGSRVAARQEMESFEEANDFEPEEHDEDQMDTVYTVPEMIPELNPDGFVEKLDGSPAEALPGETPPGETPPEATPPGETPSDVPPEALSGDPLGKKTEKT
ncbi:hypothetical protein [Microviridae sp.]|nr:hypothetical protein [Microviridae sp.]